MTLVQLGTPKQKQPNEKNNKEAKYSNRAHLRGLPSTAHGLQ